MSAVSQLRPISCRFCGKPIAPSDVHKLQIRLANAAVYDADTDKSADFHHGCAAEIWHYFDGPTAQSKMPSLTPETWQKMLVRHGLWIGLFVAVTVWELLGLAFPVKSPAWFAHPTISQEVKHIRGNSLAGRVSLTAVLVAVCGTLIWHWGWSG